MRVHVVEYCPGYPFSEWESRGDYEVLAESKDYYKVKTSFGEKWYPKSGPWFKCEPVRGWRTQ